jgi:hypothetical protein
LHFRKLIYLLLLTSFLTLLSCSQNPEVIEHGIFAPNRLESVIGQDGVCSIDFDDKITLWTFADTILGEWKSEDKILSGLIKDDAVFMKMIPNSLAWTAKTDKKNIHNPEFNFILENGIVTPFIKNRKDEDLMKHRLWAVDGIRIDDAVYVYYLHIYVPDPEKLLEFETLYAGLAKWEIPEGWSPGDPVDFKRVGKIFKNNPPAFGSTVVKKDGYIYTAGHYKGEGLSFPIKIARVETGKIENSDDYTFLKSDGTWTGDIKKSDSFLGDVSGECSLNWNEYLKEYVIIYVRVFTGEIVLVRFKDFKDLSDAEKKVVYKIPGEVKGAMWHYSGKEIYSSGRSIFMIYINPDTYQPMLVEIKL